MSPDISIAGHKITADLQTLTDFVNTEHTLLPEEKRERFLAIERVFAEHAYNSEAPHIKTCKRNDDCIKAFSASVFKVADELGLSEQTACRMIANILKVCKLLPEEPDDERSVLGIQAYQKGTARCSGWILSKYLHNERPVDLFKVCGMAISENGLVEPFTLLAIQRFQETVEKIDKGERTSDFPYNMFVEVALFADAWGSRRMRKDLKKITKTWEEFPPPSREEEHIRVLQLYGVTNVVKARKYLSDDDGYKQEIPLVDKSMDDESEPSLFDQSQPIESILQFTASCSSLSTEQ